MPFGNGSPIFIRPAYPSIRSSSRHSTSTLKFNSESSTPETSPCPSPLQTNNINSSQYTEPPTLTLPRTSQQSVTSGEKEIDKNKGKCPPTSSTTNLPWYMLQARTSAPHLTIHIPHSSYPHKDCACINSRPSHSKQAQALQLLPNPSPYPRRMDP